MKPNINTLFRQLSDITNYSDKENYYCCDVVFSPETENEHFPGCPPYIAIVDIEKSYSSEYIMYFEVPEIIAYYAKTHPCYTLTGLENREKEGERKMANKIKALLNI